MTDAKEYGKALFELAEESGKTDALLSELGLVRAAFDENPEYKKLLDTPALPKDEKLALIDGAFGGVDEYILNLLKILCERHSVYLFSKIADSFAALYDEAREIERVEAITVISMTEAQIKAMKTKLEAITGKTVIIRNTVDKTILGGVVLRYSGVQLDGSIKTRLEDFRRSLSNIVM